MAGEKESRKDQSKKVLLLSFSPSKFTFLPQFNPSHPSKKHPIHLGSNNSPYLSPFEST